MTRPLLQFLFLASCTVVSLPAWCKEPGGHGSIKSDAIGLYNKGCFKSKILREIDIELCADYTINWRLWTVAGEPVGDYNLSWKLRSIALKNSSRMGIYQDGISYRPDTLPKELQKGVRAIELYIDGVAVVTRADNSYAGVSHAFDTGVPVRANAGSSYNTPGSPSWDKVLLRSNACPAAALGNPYLDAKAAKEEFEKGIQLSNVTLCPKSGLSELSAFESAIDNLCKKPGADKEYAFCLEQKRKEKKDGDKAHDAAKEKDGKGKKTAKKRESASDDNILDGASSGARTGEEESIADMLDAEAEKPQIAQRLEQERDAYRPKAVAACESTMRAVDTCYAKTNCRMPDETPTVEQCNAIPAYPHGHCYPFCLTRVPGPGEVCYREDAECRAARAEGARREAEEKEELARQQSAWHSNYESLSKECAQRKKERDEFSGCQRQYGATCNPKGFAGQNACVEHMMATSGPTAKGARARLKKEWDANARAAQSAPASRKHDEPNNFLD